MEKKKDDVFYGFILTLIRNYLAEKRRILEIQKGERVMKSVLMTGIVCMLGVMFLLVPGKAIFAKDGEGITGWERDSPYNKLYDPRERDTIKGKVIKFKRVTPLPGMASGTAFILEESKDEKVLIHLCPESYAKAKATGIKRGNKVKVKGAWVEIDGEDIFIAAKVKKGDHFEFKVRLTSDGTPFWTMTPEQLAKEKK